MQKKVVIVGLGYVGLPLACLCAKKLGKVLGLEIRKEVVKKINNGVSHIRDNFLQKNLSAVKGKIFATTSPTIINQADVIIVCVPTPVHKNNLPDLGPLKKSCYFISSHLKKRTLVIIESTIYPGTTAEIIKPILEKSGLKAETDFFLVHCPERIDPGNKKWGVENIPRVLGGLSKKGAFKAKKFYESILSSKITVLNSSQEAEAVKVVENSFRDINIAFVNELAKSFAKLHLDIEEVIKGASTKPFGFTPFYPGPGVGGHCIPVDPYYLIQRARKEGFEHKLLSLARQTNNSMPLYTFKLVKDALKKSGKKRPKIALLGLSYKAEIDDVRESPAMKILSLLKKNFGKVFVFDPFVRKFSNCTSLKQAINMADCAIVATNHKLFTKKLSANFLKRSKVKAVVDARNCLDKEKIISKGIYYKGIGR